MTQDEARQKIFELILEHKLHDEMWLGLTISQVNVAILRKLAGKREFKYKDIIPELVVQRASEMVERTADEMIIFTRKPRKSKS